MRIDELAVLDLRQHDLAPDAERHIGGKPSCPPHAFGDSVLEPPGELPDRVARSLPNQSNITYKIKLVMQKRLAGYQHKHQQTMIADKLNPSP